MDDFASMVQRFHTFLIGHGCGDQHCILEGCPTGRANTSAGTAAEQLSDPSVAAAVAIGLARKVHLGEAREDDLMHTDKGNDVIPASKDSDNDNRARNDDGDDDDGMNVDDGHVPMAVEGGSTTSVNKIEGEDVDKDAAEDAVMEDAGANGDSNDNNNVSVEGGVDNTESKEENRNEDDTMDSAIDSEDAPSAHHNPSGANNHGAVDNNADNDDNDDDDVDNLYGDDDNGNVSSSSTKDADKKEKKGSSASDKGKEKKEEEKGKGYDDDKDKHLGAEEKDKEAEELDVIPTAPPSEDFGPLLLTLTDACLASPEDEDAKQRVIVSIGKTFSYLHNVEAAFWSRDTAGSIRYRGMRYAGHAVDLQSVLHFWANMRKLPDAHEKYTTICAARVSELQLTLNEHTSAVVLRALAVIMFIDPELQDPDTHDSLFSKMLKLLAALPQDESPQPMRGSIARGISKSVVEAWWSTLGAEIFSEVIGAVHQFITFRILSRMELDEPIYHASSVLAMLHRVNEETRFVDYTAFHNDAVNGYVAIDQDYSLWRGGGPNAKHTFCNFPFMLNPAAKSELLEADSRWQMAEESRQAIFNTLFSGMRHSQRLILHVRRSEIVRDTLSQLAGKSSRTSELKKPLFVKFRDEEGQDEGGVKKEFFQLIVRQLFDPQYAMFVDLESRGCYWFSLCPFGSAVEYELIGTVLGLAIFNSVILEVKFPVVVYRKLLGQPVGLRDFAEIEPETARGLQQLLDFDGDVESVFARNFEVTYEVLGATNTVPLKEGGADIPVTVENRQEYVDLYVDFFLNKSIKDSFGAFNRGFERVCGGFALKLFHAEELELLISGNPTYDFDALEESTTYDGGYSAESEPVKWFWEIVHAYPEEKKRTVLAFVTGSDRVPIRGLPALNFRIVRASPDTERLPSASTCFSLLLLPEYSSKEKLETKLNKALELGSEGFGNI